VKTIASNLEIRVSERQRQSECALTPLADAASREQPHSDRPAGGLMMGIVSLSFLIACVNLANLLLAQAARREKEIGLRAALGPASAEYAAIAHRKLGARDSVGSCWIGDRLMVAVQLVVLSGRPSSWMRH